MVEIRAREPLCGADADALARCARDEAAWRALPKLGEARRSSVARLRLSAGPVVVKRYRDPGAFRLLTFARRSRAEREARALDLVGAALPENAVRALAWGEERRFGFVARSWLVTAELEQSFDLRRIKTLRPPERGAAVRAVPGQLPRLVARLHARGIFAVTLRGKNVLLQPDTGRIALIDLPYARAVAQARRAPPRARSRDPLARAAQVSRRAGVGSVPRALSRRGERARRRGRRSDQRGAHRARGGARGTPDPALGRREARQAPLPPQPDRRMGDRATAYRGASRLTWLCTTASSRPTRARAGARSAPRAMRPSTTASSTSGSRATSSGARSAARSRSRARATRPCSTFPAARAASRRCCCPCRRGSSRATTRPRC